MSKKTLESIFHDAYYEETKQELACLPSDDELRREFPVTKEKRDKFIKRVYGKKKPVYIYYLQRVAVFVLVFSAVSFGAMMLNPEIRAGMLEKGIKLFDEYIQFDFSEDKSDYKVDFDNIEIGYIPEGYILTEHTIYNDAQCYRYTTTEDYLLSIDIISTDSNINKYISDQFVDFTPITIDGLEGYTSYDQENNYGIVVYGNSNFQIYIIGDMSIDELVKIAKRIKC